MKHLFRLAAVTLLLFGCSKSEEQIQPEVEKLPINLSLTQSRADDTAYQAGDAVGLYVVNYTGSTAGTLAASGNQVNNMRYILGENGLWVPDTQPYWKNNSTKADFYVYYPYRATVTDTETIEVEVQQDQSSSANYWNSDLLWGKTEGIAPTSSAVQVATNHVMSNILIYIEAGFGITPELLAAADITVAINNLQVNGTLDLSTGVVKATGETATITPYKESNYYRALIIPQTISDNQNLLTVTVNGKVFALARNMTFNPNTQHSFTIRIDLTQAGIELSINPWNVDSTEYAIPDNEIWYTSSDGNVTESNNATVFGANLVSNNYINGRGIMIFDKPITTIGYEAFQCCSSLATITIPEGVAGIGCCAFQGCHTLTSVTIPNSVTLIDNYAFLYCTSLTSVIIPEGVKTIGLIAFSNCNALTSISIPNSVTEIRDGAFSNCPSLIEFRGKFASNDGRCLIVDGTLNSFAPAGLTDYTIPDNVTIIGSDAFVHCSTLTSITIPQSVKTIENAFGNCSSLNSVYCKATTPPSLGEFAFVNHSKELKIYVPASDDDSILSAYKTAWSEYADVIEEYDFSAEL